MSKDERLALYRKAMTRLKKAAGSAAKSMPDDTVFVIYMFLPNEDGVGSYAGYVSNGSQEEVIESTKECISTLEANRDVGSEEDIPQLH